MALNSFLRSNLATTRLLRRGFYKNHVRIFSVGKPALDKKLLTITFIKANGDRVKATGKVGENLLDVVLNSSMDLDGFGACEGTLTCSTCHLILKQEDYDSLPKPPSDEECDMLDLAFDLTDTSRLACQVILTEKLDGMEVKIPATLNDARS